MGLSLFTNLLETKRTFNDILTPNSFHNISRVFEITYFCNLTFYIVVFYTMNIIQYTMKSEGAIIQTSVDNKELQLINNNRSRNHMMKVDEKGRVI